jgi:hypothetical protein
VRRPRTCAALGSSRIRGADATIARDRCAGRSAAALAVLAAVAALAGCDPRQTGNGVYAEKTVHVAPFTGIHVQDGIDAVVTVSSTATQSVVVTGDQNIVEENIQTRVDAEGVGSAAIAVLHVWASPSFTPVIPPRVVIRRPTLAAVRGGDGVVIEVTTPTGANDGASPRREVLDGATLSARQYPTAGAVVDLEGRSTAQLHSDGPVTGTVSAGSHLDNTHGAGGCGGVATGGTGNVVCNGP